MLKSHLSKDLGKKFEIDLSEKYELDIARRVTMARLYLCELEIAEKRKMGIIND